jgi:hypothetical protein
MASNFCAYALNISAYALQYSVYAPSSRAYALNTSAYAWTVGGRQCCAVPSFLKIRSVYFWGFGGQAALRGDGGQGERQRDGFRGRNFGGWGGRTLIHRVPRCHRRRPFALPPVRTLQESDLAAD